MSIPTLNKKEQKIGNFLTNSPKRGRVKEKGGEKYVYTNA